MFNKKEYMKRYHKINSEKEKEYRRQYNIINATREKERKKQWNKDNPEYNKQWCIDNHEKVIRCKRQYYIKNKEKILERERKYLAIRRSKDTKYNISKRMSNLIRTSLKGNKNGYHWETLVGYSCDNLIKHLRKTMPEGYNWQDYLEGKLHLDHVIPKSVFNYTKPEHPDFKRCWSINNLRLLPARENRSKYNKLIKPFQPSLAI